MERLCCAHNCAGNGPTVCQREPARGVARTGGASASFKEIRTRQRREGAERWCELPASGGKQPSFGLIVPLGLGFPVRWEEGRGQEMRPNLFPGVYSAVSNTLSSP